MQVKLSKFMIFLTPFILSCTQVTATAWSPYTFTGSVFVPAGDAPANAVWLRPGFTPRTGAPINESADGDRLPPGYGAVAGICFMQKTGGKLSDSSSFSPYPNEQITVHGSRAETSATRTDDRGFFIEVLSPGNYDLFCRGVKISTTVRNGETTLISIRGGKRMAD